MLEIILVATGGVILVGLYVAYDQSKDPFHPAVMLAGPFAYFFSVWPLLLNRSGGLEEYLPRDKLEHAALLFLCSIVALYVGLVHQSNLGPLAMGRWFTKLTTSLSPQASRRLYSIAVLMGMLALAAYASSF